MSHEDKQQNSHSVNESSEMASEMGNSLTPPPFSLAASPLPPADDGASSSAKGGGGVKQLQVADRETATPQMALQRALSLSPAAVQLIRETIARLNAARLVIRSAGSMARQSLQERRRRISADPNFHMVQTHFHIVDGGINDRTTSAQLETAANRIAQIIARYNGILGTIGNRGTVFRSSQATGDGAGAGAYLPTSRDGHIYFTPLFLRASGGDFERTIMIIHESAHFQSDSIIDYSRPGTTNYRRLHFDQAMNNAYSYSQLVINAAQGRDQVLTQEAAH